MRGWSRALGVALVLLAAACTSSEPPPETPSIGEVRIGVLAPLSKQDKPIGTDALRGAQLAAGLVNGEEGEVPLAGVGTAGLSRLGGAKVTIVSGDTGGDAAQGTSEAARLVTDERVVGLVGAYHTEVTDAASQRSERLGVPFVNGDSSADFLTERGLDWFFRTGPTDRMLGESFFSALRRVGDRGAQTIGILHVVDRPGSVVAELTSNLAAQGGFQVARVASFLPDQQDVVPAVSQIQAKRPDAVFVVGSSPDNTKRALQAFGRLGYTPPGLLVFGAGFFEPATLEAAGADGRGLLYSSAWSREVAARSPAARQVMELYEQKYGQPMSEVAAGSFTAVLTLAKAMDDAGSIQPDRVRAALLNLDVPGRDTIMPWNSVRFDTTHQNAGAAGLVEQVEEDVFRVVFPAELAQAEPKWPLATARG